MDEQFKRAAGLGSVAEGVSVVWRKKSLDARGKVPYFLVSADVYSKGESPELSQGFIIQNVSSANKVVHIIGAGPAGLFAALAFIELGIKPIIIERGKEVRDRRRDLAKMNKELVVNPESNYCFGERWQVIVTGKQIGRAHV